MTTPTTLEGVDKLVGMIAEAKSRIDKHEARAEERIAAIKEDLRVATEADRKLSSKIMDKLVVFASENRYLIVTEACKTVTLHNGSISLYFTPVAAECKDDDKLVETLEKMGLDNYVRTYKAPNRELLGEDKAFLPKIAGLSFSRKEKLSVSPIGASAVVRTRTVSV